MNKPVLTVVIEGVAARAEGHKSVSGSIPISRLEAMEQAGIEPWLFILFVRLSYHLFRFPK
jgi:hypothetical protein